MNIPSLQEIKQELNQLSPKEILELCLYLAKYKKENKEYLGYLLFHANNQEGFITYVKTEIDTHFAEMHPQKNLYYIKKSLRKLLRVLNKYCKYMDNKSATAQVLLYFCVKIKQADIPIHKSPKLVNLFNAQEKKIRYLISFLHEDLQADYSKELDRISPFR